MDTMKRRDFLKTGIAGAGALAGAAGMNCGTAPVRQPNVLWFILDDGRADNLGCYGRPWVNTPNFDRIARSGVMFRNAIVQNPVCVPSRSSMLSGEYGHTIGMMAMGKEAEIPPPYWKSTDGDRPNLLEAWTQAGITPENVGKRHGYDTYFNSRGDIRPHFDVYGAPRTDFAKARMAEFPDRVYPEAVTRTHGWAIGGRVPFAPEETTTWELGTNAVNTLNELAGAGQPFFLRVSFHDPHVPCSVPDDFYVDPATIDLPLPTAAELASKPRFERENLRVYAGADLTREQIGIARGTYYGMINLVDVQIGRILAALDAAGLTDDTIIAVNSDQGFQLGEHGLWKKRVFYDDNVRVPLLMSCPRVLPRNKIIDSQVELIDFMPTVMELSGYTPPSTIAGRSLMPLIRGDVGAWKEATFCEMDHSQSMYEELRHTGRRVMVRTEEWKLVAFMDERVADPDGALYNLADDPGETVNLYNDRRYSDIIARLEETALDWARKA